MSSTELLTKTEDEAAPQETATAKTGLVKFGECDGFLRELRGRVDTFFRQSGRHRKDCPRIYVKAFVIMGWLAGSYALLVFWATAWWQIVPLAISLGLAMAGVGFNIQHDGSHGAFSRFAWVNRLAAMTLDLLGGSSYLWKRKHNVVHHTYTNITGHDSDIDIGFMGRLSPHQPHLGFHRLQHWYLWGLYGMITFKWQFWDDFVKLFQRQIGQSPIKLPKGWDLALFVAGKLTFVSLAIVLPLMFHAWYVVVGAFLLASFVQGLMLAVVFQLAHVMEEAQYPMPTGESSKMESAWAVHQVQTTLNFAPRNPIVTWYTGGLNYQIEHHLFPQICHINYPALSAVVKKTCTDFDISYVSHPTVRSAIGSHYRLLKQLSKPNVESSK